MTTQQHPGLKLADIQTADDLVPDERPSIGVIVSLWFPDMNDASTQMLYDLTSGGVQAVRDAGGRPVLIDSADEATQATGTQWHAEIDAFVYLGGADIHPGLFSEVALSEQLRGIDPKADGFCIESIQRAVSEDSPVFAICRGSQLLNVAMGGSVIQHIEDHRAVIDEEGNIAFIDEHVTLEPNSKVAEILGTTTAVVRGAHHQAVDEIGRGLRPVAFAHDGIVEATEHVEKTWVVGVQWHPEEAHANRADLHELFGALVAQARKPVAQTAEQL